MCGRARPPAPPLLHPRGRAGAGGFVCPGLSPPPPPLWQPRSQKGQKAVFSPQTAVGAAGRPLLLARLFALGKVGIVQKVAMGAGGGGGGSLPGILLCSKFGHSGEFSHPHSADPAFRWPRALFCSSLRMETPNPSEGL